jgi:hypothetical protein
MLTITKRSPGGLAGKAIPLSLTFVPCVTPGGPLTIRFFGRPYEGTSDFLETGLLRNTEDGVIVPFTAMHSLEQTF